MLMDFFRRHEKLLYWVLLPVIMIPFVFYYGGGPGAMDAGNPPLAEILHKRITVDDAADEAARCFGGVDSNWVRRDPAALVLALNRLLYVAAVEGSGLRVSDAEVDQALERLRLGERGLPATDGRSFDGPALAALEGDERAWGRVRELAGRFPALFHERIAAWKAGRLRRADFDSLREVVRDELLLMRHARLLTDAAKVSSPRLYQEYLDQHTRLRVRWVKADAQAFEALIPSAELGDEALAKRFEALKDKPPPEGYQVPEQARVAWLLADAGEIAKEFPVDPADVEAYYGSHKEYWGDPEDHTKTVPLEKVRDSIVRELNRDKVQARIDDAMYEALNAGAAEDFGTLAQRLGLKAGASDADLSDMPKLEGPGFVRDLGETLKALEPGARAERSLDCEKGRVLVRLLSKSPAHAPEFPAVRETILSDLKKERARAMAEEALGRIRAAAGENLDEAFQEAAKAAGRALSTGVTESFTDPRLGEDKLPNEISRHRDAAEAAFALEGVGGCTEPLFDGDEGIVLQVAERSAPEAAGFADARKGLTQRATNAMARMLERDWREAVSRKTTLFKMPQNPGME